MANAPLNREEILAGHFLLRHLRPEELSRLAASASLVRHRPQATIFQKGDPGGSMMAVVRGRVKICTYSADGKELVLNIIDRGGLFGEIALARWPAAFGRRGGDRGHRVAGAGPQPSDAVPERQPGNRHPVDRGAVSAPAPDQRSAGGRAAARRAFACGARTVAAGRDIRQGGGGRSAAGHQAFATADRQPDRYFTRKHQQVYRRVDPGGISGGQQRVHHDR